MFTGLVVGGIILIAALLVFAGWCMYRWGRDVGYDEARTDRAQGELAERQAVRHAKGRTSLVRDEKPSPASHPDQRPTSKSRQGQPSRWYLPPPGPIRSHTSATDLARMVLPEPGAYKPQPGRDSHPGTATLPRYGSVAYALDAAGVRPRLGLPATTGEMQAITDDWIADMHEQEEAFRKALTS